MAQEYVDPVGGSLIIPASYASITVAPNNSGLSTTGVIVLLGEADSGPSFSEEEDLASNAFGPDELQSVIDKYKSGRIVDAFRAAATAAVDPDINASFTRCIIAKTNTGTKASSAVLSQNGVTAYDSFVARLAGSLGSLVYYTISNPTTETAPTTGLFSYIPQPGIVTLDVRVSGGIAEQVSVAANTTPAAFQAAIQALTNVNATGGGARTAIPAGTPNLTLAVAGYVGTFTLAVNWDASVTAGDTLYIPAASGFDAAGENEGWWLVTAVAGGVLTARKMSDTSTTPGHVAGSVVAPVAVGTTAVNVNHDLDLIVYASVNISDATAVTPGVGKTMEIAGTSALAGDTDARNMFKQLGSTSTVTWLAVSGTAATINSTSELSVKVNMNRQVDNVSDSFTAGGEVGLKLGYQGYSAVVVIDSTSFQVTYKLTQVSANTVVTLSYEAYPTISDLVAYLNSISGFTAAAGTAVIGNLPTSALDRSVWGAFNTSYNAATTWGGYGARIKIDAYRVRTLAATSLTLAEFSAGPGGGLPNVQATNVFLTGGAKGATLALNVADAFTALEGVQANFVIPLMSRDASEDIIDGLTDAASTYQIDAVNALAKSHVHAMSTMKAKRNRQAFISKRGTFSVVTESAANIASHRCTMVFQDVKSAVTGSIVQYQPYMAAVLAAATQSGTLYRSLVRKQVNISAAIQAAGDFKYTTDSHLENALKAGLNPIRKAEEGGFVWVSDQTTYGKDAKNFYNSTQMVYTADLVALTTAQRMERAFVGKSVSDTSAAVALSYLDGIMFDLARLRMIAPSSDAPFGYKNAKIKIEGAVMRVSLEVKIAGSIYFIPIAFYVTEVTQSA